MERQDQIKIKDRLVTVREMTVQEVYDLLEGRMQPPGDLEVDVLIEHRIGSGLMVMLSDLSIEDLRGMTGSELTALGNKIADINPFYVRLLEKLSGLDEPTPQPSAKE